MVKQALIFGWLLCGAAAFGGSQNFDFKDPKGVNNVVFKTDAPLESINGTATEVSGAVQFDPADPGAVKGKLMVAAASLHVPNPLMKEHLQGPMWLDVAKYPSITFEVVSAAKVVTKENSTTAEVTGNLTIKDVTKKVTVPVKFTYLEGKLKDRVPSLKGDLLVLRGKFAVKRSDFGINAGKGEDKVADEIELTLSLAGQSPR